MVVRIFEIAADNPGRKEAVDKFLRCESVTGLEVGRHRTGDRIGDASDKVEDDVGIAQIVVLHAEHAGDRPARRPQGARADRLARRIAPLSRVRRRHGVVEVATARETYSPTGARNAIASRFQLLITTTASVSRHISSSEKSTRTSP